MKIFIHPNLKNRQQKTNAKLTKQVCRPSDSGQKRTLSASNAAHGESVLVYPHFTITLEKYDRQTDSYFTLTAKDA